ncbi:hypothetical protein C8J56DRAFT_1059836 [Mycena floridula]|nr:hypothetical protein C8J56DRAFT_1059836 [Mycena floridula]
MLLFSISFIAFGALLTSAQAPLWSQCGGQAWTGPTTCVTGALLSSLIEPVLQIIRAATLQIIHAFNPTTVAA